MTFDRNSSIQRRWRELPPGTTRTRWFESLRDAIRESYLSEPGNPYRGSGRSGGAARWLETRGLLADGLDRSGHYLDVGCANGLLLEDLVRWASEASQVITPHGVDFVPELIELARARHPEAHDNFHVGNAFDFVPPRRYDWVRTNLEYVPLADRPAMVLRLLETAVAPGGTLIVCHYRDAGEALIDVAAFVESLGLAVVRRGHAPGVEVVWVQPD